MLSPDWPIQAKKNGVLVSIAFGKHWPLSKGHTREKPWEVGESAYRQGQL